MPLDEVGLAGRVHPDGDVRLPHGEVEVGVVQQQHHRHLGVEAEEAVQARRQPDVPEARRARHLEPPGRALAAFGEQRLRHRQLGEDLAHGPVQGLAGLGEDQAAGVPVEQRHLQRLLQRLDLARHGGLAEVQRLAGVREAAGVGDRVEHAQLVPVHPVARSLSRPASPRRRAVPTVASRAVLSRATLR